MPQKKSFQTGFKEWHRFIFVCLFASLKNRPIRVAGKTSRMACKNSTAIVWAFSGLWMLKPRSLDIILWVSPSCFLHPFLSSAKSSQHVYKLTKIWQPRVRGPIVTLNSSKNTCSSALGLGNSLTRTLSSIFHRRVKDICSSSVSSGSLILKSNCLIVSSEWKGSSDTELGKLEYSGEREWGADSRSHISPMIFPFRYLLCI